MTSHTSMTFHTSMTSHTSMNSHTLVLGDQMLLDLFGYKRGELDGKNVSILMPQPFR